MTSLGFVERLLCTGLFRLAPRHGHRFGGELHGYASGQHIL